MKPLRPLRRRSIDPLGVNAELCMHTGNEIAEGDFWTYEPRDLLRLARWCEKAARRLAVVKRRTK